jgi:hypothetical protein
MNGKTHKMRRRLSVAALAASIAAVAVPAATAGGGYEAGLVPSKLGSPDPHNLAQKHQAFSPSMIDRWIGSPDPRDSAGGVLDEPSMDEVHLYPRGGADESFSTRSDAVSSEILRGAAQEHGASGFLGQTTNVREIILDAAQEHGAAGFGNTAEADRYADAASSVLTPDYSHLPSEDRP